jgi:hypothetical protein
MPSISISRLLTSLTLMAAYALIPAVHAQVFKCKDASGKLTYQSAPCDAGQQESRPVILKGPTLTDEEKFNAAAYSAGTTPAEARQRLQAAEQPSATNAGRTNSGTDDRQVSITSDHSASTECARAKREVDIARSSVTMSEGQRLSKVASLQRQAEMACLGPDGYAKAEAARAEGKERARQRRNTTPSVITSCDAGGCSDNLGNRYSGTGDVMHGSNGKTCVRSGTTLNCN